MFGMLSPAHQTLEAPLISLVFANCAWWEIQVGDPGGRSWWPLLFSPDDTQFLPAEHSCCPEERVATGLDRSQESFFMSSADLV